VKHNKQRETVTAQPKSLKSLFPH